jgi:hypothetical protein
MLTHDLASTVVAERDRVIREAVRAHRAAARPSVISRLLGRLAYAMGGHSQTAHPQRTQRQALARELGAAVPGVSARGGSHGQRAC